MSILIQRKHQQFLLVLLLLGLFRTELLAQTSAHLFPQMPVAVQFSDLTRRPRKIQRHFSPVVIIRQQVPINGNLYTEFGIREGKLKKYWNANSRLPFALRLFNNELRMPLEIGPRLRENQQKIDSLGSTLLENTFFSFEAPVGTKWICPSSYSSGNRWNTVTTQLKWIERMPDGETLYVLSFSEEYYGVSDYEYLRELTISRERGIIAFKAEGMIGGESVYVLCPQSRGISSPNPIKSP